MGTKRIMLVIILTRCENDSLPSISWVVDLAKAAVLRHGVEFYHYVGSLKME